MKFLGHKAKNQTWKAGDFTKIGPIYKVFLTDWKTSQSTPTQMTSIPSNWTILPTLAVNVEKYIQKKTFSKHRGKEGQYSMKSPHFGVRIPGYSVPLPPL